MAKDPRCKRPCIGVHKGEIDRHIEKYIDPYIGLGDDTHLLGKDCIDFKIGTELTIHAREGHNVQVSVNLSSGRYKLWLPVTHIQKPGKVYQNEGIKSEKYMAKWMHHYGLMRNSDSPGCSKVGADLYIQYPGHKDILGENKNGISKTNFGTIAFSSINGSKRSIPSKSILNKPNFSRAINEAKGPNRQSYLKYLNDNFKPDGKTYHPVLWSENMDIEPIHAYLRDIGCHWFHVEGFGTYRGGLSRHHDVYGLGFPLPKGKTAFQIFNRPDRPSDVSIRLKVKELEKSNIHIFGDEKWIRDLKIRLGYDQKKVA